MFRRASCPLDPDSAIVALKAIRRAAKELDTEIPVEVRWFSESKDYGDGLAIAIDTKASREAILVAEAIALTIYESVWWFTDSHEAERETTEVKDALNNEKETYYV